MTRTWYRIANAADDASVADIYVNDFIGDWIDDYWGFGVTARAFLEALSKLDASVKTIRVHLNSPGGDVFAASQIANALRDQRTSKGRTVETIVDGLAASAATLIMMAGNPVKVADNALVMVHNPWSVGVGNAAQMRKLADDLDAVRNTIVATYQWHSKLDAEALIALMDAETWMSADEAIANGFATDKVEGLAAAASLDRRALAKLTIPDQFKDRVEAFTAKEAPKPVAASAVDVIRLCREGGVIDIAEALVAEQATADVVQTRIAAAKQTRAAETTRRDQITALCAKHKASDLAPGYIKGSMTVDDVRAHLTLYTAAVDKAEIDTGIKPSGGARPQATLNPAEIYAARNGQKKE